MTRRLSSLSTRRHDRRRVVQAAVLLLGAGVPWLDLVRIDLPAARVIFAGRAFPLEWPYVLGLILPFLVVVWALALLSRVKGRVFCGWACPYGSLVEYSEGLRTAFGLGSSRKVAGWMRRSRTHRLALRSGAVLTLVAAPVLLALSLAAYLVPPARIRLDLMSLPAAGHLGQGVLWAWIGLVLVGSWTAVFVVRFHFCRMVCIYGMGQAMAASSADPGRILRPRFRPAELDACGHCQACVKACFLELDPRAPELRLGFSSGCFNCGDCIDRCETVQGHRNQASLLTFEPLAVAGPSSRDSGQACGPQGRSLERNLEEDGEDGLS